MDNKPCKCGGFNEECPNCFGSGIIKSEKVETFQRIPSKEELIRENKEMNEYLHPKSEKLYIETSKSLKAPKKENKKKPGKQLKIEDKKVSRGKKKKSTIFVLDNVNTPSKFIGTNNPHRKTNTHTKPKRKRKK